MTPQTNSPHPQSRPHTSRPTTRTFRRSSGAPASGSFRKFGAGARRPASSGHGTHPQSRPHHTTGRPTHAGSRPQRPFGNRGGNSRRGGSNPSLVRGMKDGRPQIQIRKPRKYETERKGRYYFSMNPVDKKEASGAPKEPVLRIIPLGGMEEVGLNMMVFEYLDEIIVVDMGLSFPEEDMPGVDYIVPNTTYWEGKEDRVKGIVITHAHYDHIGGMPFLIPRLKHPVIYATEFTEAMINKRQTEFGDTFKINTIDENSNTKISKYFSCEYFRVNHNIPGCVGLIITTPVGRIIHTGDFKIDHSPVADEPVNIQRLAQISADGIRLLMSDSTNADRPGYQKSEKEIGRNLEEFLTPMKGRIIIAAFASLLSRVQSVFDIAKKMNRKVVVLGRSMETNVEIAFNMGYLKFSPDMLVSAEQGSKMPPEKLIILSTGGQGEENAALTRMANGEHRFFEIEAGDTVVFSASVIPGNEGSVQKLQDQIYRKGGSVMHYKMLDVHAGGHARQEDLKMFLRLINPQFFMPIEGMHAFLKMHGQLAEDVGIPKENIVIGNNGQIVELTNNSIRLTNEKVPSEYVMVDGLGVGDVGEVVLRDRQELAQDGMFIVICTVDKHGKLINQPDLISRGFVYVKEHKDLMDEVRNQITKMFEGHNDQTSLNATEMRDRIRDDIGAYLFAATERRPMVLPVIVEV